MSLTAADHLLSANEINFQLLSAIPVGFVCYWAASTAWRIAMRRDPNSAVRQGLRWAPDATRRPLLTPVCFVPPVAILAVHCMPFPLETVSPSSSASRRSCTLTPRAGSAKAWPRTTIDTLSTALASHWPGLSPATPAL